MLIVEYCSRWKEDFNKIKEVLTQALSPFDSTIEHVGSTSVEGLAAKPIIDIDLIYYKTNALKDIIQKLESIGYLYVGNQGIPGREVFKRDKTHQNHHVLDDIRHHLYACHCENLELKRHLAFRDHLRKDEEAKVKYEKLKLDIANQANQEKKKYALLKEEQARDFIESILAKAFTTTSDKPKELN